MKLVLDNNILFSLMKPDSVNSYLFSSIKAEFFAPEFIIFEFNKYKKICLSKSGLSEQEFGIRYKEVKSNIKFFKASEYEEFLKKAEAVSSDFDDIDFLALALKLNAFIWSNDKRLKEQSLIEVLSTSELIKVLGL